MPRTPLVFALGASLAAGCTSSDRTLTNGPLPPCAGAASTVTLGVGAYTTYDIASDSGCAVFPANPSPSDSAEYLVVVQAAGGSPGDSAPYRIEADLARSGPARGTAAVPPRHAPAGGAIQAAFEQRLRERARRRAAARAGPVFRGAAAAAAVVPPTVGSLRSFSVCSDLNCTAYGPVTARALDVGAHVALYEDTLAPADGFAPADLVALERVFDTRVYPLDTLAFGRESDTDGNGVVIVLLTNAVNRLVTASQCDTGGYITGFFDAADLDPATAAQHNHGEVFYGMVPDPAGMLSCPHGTARVSGILPGTFAHEFEHMINFVQHVLVHGGRAEDDWIDEGLAKFAEELTARSYLPADTASFAGDVFQDLYCAGQYLLAPDAHFLLTTTDQSFGDVGAGWLFVRWLVDQRGAGITRTLVQTSLTGTANVTQAAGLPFATLAARWALANWVSDLPGFGAPGELRYASWSFRPAFAGLNLQDPMDFPRPFPLVPATVTAGALGVSGSLRAGSGVYLLVHQDAGEGPDTLHVNAGAAALPASLEPRFAVIRLH
ncbi:MAG TPA: hypothetical protein VMF70_14650 [Gemmatimonadales bacterium]|nr:hypothetical protein [Gemmatimonadales bacterium]